MGTMLTVQKKARKTKRAAPVTSCSFGGGGSEMLLLGWPTAFYQQIGPTKRNGAYVIALGQNSLGITSTTYLASSHVVEEQLI